MKVRILATIGVAIVGIAYVVGSIGSLYGHFPTFIGSTVALGIGVWFITMALAVRESNP